MQLNRPWKKLLLLALGLLAANGCVRRRLTVRTNPPGAMIYVDRQPIGPSPASVPFVYYGTRQITAVGDGYRTENVLRTLYPPWYQIPPLDFISETLWPWKIRDQRVVDITMLVEPTVSTEELVARGEELRTQTAAGIAVPLKRTQGPASVPERPIATAVPAANSPYGTLPYGTVPATTSPQLGGPAGSLPDMGTAPVLPPQSPGPTWRPGQFLRNLVQPGGQPVERIPEVGAMQGGGYRPTMP